MIWGCLATSEPGRLAEMDATMTSALYHKTLKENVCDLKLKHTWFMQLDKDLKHTSMFTSECLKKTQLSVWSGPRQSPGLNPMLCQALKQAKKSEPEFLQGDVEDSLPFTANILLQLLLPRATQPVIRLGRN